MNNSHKRQNSSGNFNMNLDQNNPLETSFYSLENFMISSKSMEDEIMVPTKLKDKTFDKKRLHTLTSIELQQKQQHQQQLQQSNGNNNHHNNNDNETEILPPSLDDLDALEHYRFIRLIRSQLLQAKPFVNVDEHTNKVLQNKHFKLTFDNFNYHYKQLMGILDNLSNDAKVITDIYKENV